MARMNAAVVTSFAEPPHYQPFEVPQPNAADEFIVDVLAAGLHPRVRSGAAWAHYTSSGTLPMIPGVNAVGQRPDGTRVYFVAADDVIGTMADEALASARRSIELPDDADIAKVAAAMNPAMSSWVALRRRVPIQPGQSVLVLGATGNAGAMAVQVARRLGAGRVVGAGRDPGRLDALTSIGGPDGICLDAEGAVWVGTGGFSVARVAPGGEVLQRIELPENRAPFALMLGGPDRRTLFILTAEWRLADGHVANLDRLANGPRTGQILTLPVSVPGVGRP